MTSNSNLEPHVITLGTAGGPRWWAASDAGERTGIATAVVVGGSFYLVDFGQGAGRRLAQSGLELKDLRALFITHLHSDHVYDLAGLGLFGMYALADRLDDPVRIIGPGNRGILPPVSPRAAVAPLPLAPRLPTPGTREMFTQLMEAHATDLNDRILDSLKPSPLDLFQAEDIDIPAGSGYHPNHNPTPAMEPFPVYEDELVTVTAILVEHPPVAPAFAFRFDTADGSVTISGDTAFTQNLVTLARDTDLLLHEAIDFDWVESLYADQDDPANRAARDHHYKSHTSVRDAAKAAEAAGARRLALHHLVPGFASDRIWNEAAEHFAGPFSLPRDLDSIPFGRQR
ncbi:MBL fold metallo-hydrolase [Arthrobacter sp. ISL-30]|uniref:MBL fold metallo-hydrolase n=1 Tax=Arthrobacter sp. ISL-30 TaxID=2819109 RepID=UPI001BEA672C|nr:MBL fold metallo-hydrolase [Arthrobacter sp. ISL-30]MBT2513272.1 MBL fold metallo-hydrolase [Arthrobacter sp. ISL-30]